jgi:hypothetical protein
VSGVLSLCESAKSAGCVEATATGNCLLAPLFAGLQAVSDSHDTGCHLNLSWPAATSRCAASVTYSVYRSTTPGFTPNAGNRIASGVVGTTYQDVGTLNNGTTYYYVVRAVDIANALEETNLVEKSGAPSGPIILQDLSDTFEGALSGGGFDLAGWSHSSLQGPIDWAWSTAQSQSPTHSWFSDSQPAQSHRVLVSPSFLVNAATTLTFWHTYRFEGNPANCRDGGTLEISTNGGATWTVVPDAAFTAGGFNGTVSAPFNNPIAGKRAWCGGTIGPMTQVSVNLSSFAGQTARVRWREGDDTSTEATGWYVDSVVLSNVETASACIPGGLFHNGFETGNLVPWSGFTP